MKLQVRELVLNFGGVAVVPTVQEIIVLLRQKPEFPASKIVSIELHNYFYCIKFSDYESLTVAQSILGYEVDFVDFNINHYKIPVFNNKTNFIWILGVPPGASASEVALTIKDYGEVIYVAKRDLYTCFCGNTYENCYEVRFYSNMTEVPIQIQLGGIKMFEQHSSSYFPRCVAIQHNRGVF